MAKRTGPCFSCRYFTISDNKCKNPITILPNGNHLVVDPAGTCPDFMPRLNTTKITVSEEDLEAINDPVNHPSHYTQGKIECIDFIQDKGLNFCRGNAVKYIVRAGLKDPDKEIEDLRKAIWYIEHEIQDIERRVKNEIDIAGNSDR